MNSSRSTVLRFSQPRPVRITTRTPTASSCSQRASILRGHLSGSPPGSIDLFATAPGMEAMARMLVANGIRGWRLLEGLRPFQLSTRQPRLRKSDRSDLCRCRIVIVDLSRGSEVVGQTCSERVVNHILRRASERFRDGCPVAYADLHSRGPSTAASGQIRNKATG